MPSSAVPHGLRPRTVLGLMLVSLVLAGLYTGAWFHFAERSVLT